MSPRSLFLALLLAGAAGAQEGKLNPAPSPWIGFTSLQLSLGSMTPAIDQSPGLAPKSNPYQNTFHGSMLLFQAEGDRFLWSQYGSFGVGFSIGYAEKYAQTTYQASGALAPVKTGLQVLPLEVLAVYRMDYPALHWGVPLVPYAKLGFIYEPWWASTGGTSDGSGGRAGWGWSVGLAFVLDVIEPRLARDAREDTGILHSYLFAQYDDSIVTGFGSSGIDLSSRRWMFGLAFDF